MNRKNVIFAAGILAGAGAVWAGAAVAGGGRVSLVDIEQALSEISDNQYIPFKTQISGGTCNAAADGASVPLIIIDSNGTAGTFAVNSIHVATSGLSGAGSNLRVELNEMRIDGTLFSFKTDTLVADSASGSSIRESFDILGAPIRSGISLGVAANSVYTAGRVPHELVADSAGSSDIRVQLFCRSDSIDVSLNTITVTGWKRASDTITVSYTPGT
ncbi:MAG: hypothetical protein AAF610_15630 [Pseudomonadota bacterium]